MTSSNDNGHRHLWEAVGKLGWDEVNGVGGKNVDACSAVLRAHARTLGSDSRDRQAHQPDLRGAGTSRQGLYFWPAGAKTQLGLCRLLDLSLSLQLFPPCAKSGRQIQLHLALARKEVQPAALLKDYCRYGSFSRIALVPSSRVRQQNRSAYIACCLMLPIALLIVT